MRKPPPSSQSRRPVRRPAELTQTAPEIVGVTVHGLAVGGAAVGRVTGPEGSPLVGVAAFVPFAAPGETVTAQVRKKASRYVQADLVSVERASPERVTPRCPHFGVCGGCDIQHLSYEAQLAAKREMVAGALRAGGLGDEVEGRLEPVVASPPYAYRQRITLHVVGGEVGYYERRSRRLLRPQTCPISFAALDEWLKRGFSFIGMDAAVPSGSDLAVEAAENGVFGVLRLPDDAPGPKPAAASAIAERMAAFFTGGAVQRGDRTLARFGPETMIRGERHAAPGVFSQVNPAVNDALTERILAFAQAVGARTAYDLYAGAGNFALPLASGAGLRVFAVESDPVLVSSGRSEAKRLGLSERVLFIENPMETFLRRAPEPVDLTIADPPRAGLGPLAERFDFARSLALLSCDLASAVRDLKALRGLGWAIESLTPFDMFAQTGDVELLTLLRRP